MRVLAFIFLMFDIFISSSAAQSSRIVSDKKTIEIRASDKISSPAEVATVKIGFQNVAPSKEAVYERMSAWPIKSCKHSARLEHRQRALRPRRSGWSVRTPRRELSRHRRDFRPIRNGAFE